MDVGKVTINTANAREGLLTAFQVIHTKSLYGEAECRKYPDLAACGRLKPRASILRDSSLSSAPKPTPHRSARTVKPACCLRPHSTQTLSPASRCVLYIYLQSSPTRCSKGLSQLSSLPRRLQTPVYLLTTAIFTLLAFWPL
jgi:hypothetical protein